MIKSINNIAEVESFARSFSGDKCFSDPMLSNESQFKTNLVKSINQPQRYDTFGVYDGEELIGLFSFLRLPDENYLEMIVGLSRDKRAYDEMMRLLEERYKGYHADFVYNPRNSLMESILRAKGAEFDTEQLKMLLREPVIWENDLTIVPYSDEFKEGYKAIHNDEERYWTADKVIAAPERFRILLAVSGGEVAGYIDVTHCFDENEPFDLFVSEKFRGKGYDRALLSRAVELNRPNKMMLLVDFDNSPEISLYESLGFEIDEFGGSITASFKI